LGKVTVRGNPSDGKATREVFVPLSKNGVTNSDINVTPPSPGIIIYRFEESYLYPNSGIVQSVLVDHVRKYMRRGKDMTNVKASDRPWNDAGGRGGGETEQEGNMKKPILHAIVLDFSTV
jgi:sodium-independent sulfate anion transporter 11